MSLMKLTILVLYLLVVQPLFVGMICRGFSKRGNFSRT